MRFYQDDCSRLVRVKWFFVERKDFVPKNPFVSSYYDEQPGVDGNPVGEMHDGRTPRTGSIPAGIGIAPIFKGSAKQWAGDISLGDRVRPQDVCGPRSFRCQWATQSYVSFPPPCLPYWLGTPTVAAAPTVIFYTGESATMTWGPVPSDLLPGATGWWCPIPLDVVQALWTANYGNPSLGTYGVLFWGTNGRQTDGVWQGQLYTLLDPSSPFTETTFLLGPNLVKCCGFDQTLWGMGGSFGFSSPAPADFNGWPCPPPPLLGGQRGPLTWFSVSQQYVP